MYVCRTLSYKGADFDIVEAPLEERMMVKSYDADELSAFKLLLSLIMFSASPICWVALSPFIFLPHQCFLSSMSAL